MKAGTGQDRFEIFRLQVFPNPTRRGLETHGFSRDFFSRPEDPKKATLTTKKFFMHLIVAILVAAMEQEVCVHQLAVRLTDYGGQNTVGSFTYEGVLKQNRLF